MNNKIQARISSRKKHAQISGNLLAAAFLFCRHDRARRPDTDKGQYDTMNVAADWGGTTPAAGNTVSSMPRSARPMQRPQSGGNVHGRYQLSRHHERPGHCRGANTLTAWHIRRHHMSAANFRCDA